jgi:hypothetical protein
MSAAAMTVSTFSPADADAAFGLARLGFPDLTHARWRRLVRRWTASERPTAGAIVARDGAGRVVGFAPYGIRDDLSRGRTLWVDGVVAVSLIDSAPALRAMATALSDKARDLGCTRLKVETARADRVLRQALSRGTGAVRSTVLQATI